MVGSLADVSQGRYLAPNVLSHRALKVKVCRADGKLQSGRKVDERAGRQKNATRKYKS